MSPIGHDLRFAQMKRPLLSPLRYPGGKSVLYPLLRDTIRLNGLTGGQYIEPYAGGAGAALALLITGQVDRIVINDLDPAIHAFWQAAVGHPEELANLLLSKDATIDEWHRQKSIYEAADSSDPVALGFATFFLNRTNRSGALNGGVIGGKAQDGKYLIDARYNKGALLERFRLIRAYAKRITVSQRDGLDVIDDYSGQPSTLIYADPPYFEKSGSLYLNAFTKQDHVRLAQRLNERALESQWMLTYDRVEAVETLYDQRRRFDIPIAYSAHRVVNAVERLVVSDPIVLPPSFDKPPRDRTGG